MSGRGIRSPGTAAWRRAGGRCADAVGWPARTQDWLVALSGLRLRLRQGPLLGSALPEVVADLLDGAVPAEHRATGGSRAPAGPAHRPARAGTFSGSVPVASRPPASVPGRPRSAVPGRSHVTAASRRSRPAAPELATPSAERAATLLDAALSAGTVRREPPPRGARHSRASTVAVANVDAAPGTPPVPALARAAGRLRPAPGPRRAPGSEAHHPRPPAPGRAGSGARRARSTSSAAPSPPAGPPGTIPPKLSDRRDTGDGAVRDALRAQWSAPIGGPTAPRWCLDRLRLDAVVAADARARSTAPPLSRRARPGAASTPDLGTRQQGPVEPYRALPAAPPAAFREPGPVAVPSTIPGLVPDPGPIPEPGPSPGPVATPPPVVIPAPVPPPSPHLTWEDAAEQDERLSALAADLRQILTAEVRRHGIQG